MIQLIDASCRVGKTFVSDWANLLAQAFHEYPEYLHLVPDAKKRPRALRAYFSVMIKFTMNNGIVLVTSDEFKGVLLYLPAPARIDGKGMLKAGAIGMLFKVGRLFIVEQQKIIDAIISTRRDQDAPDRGDGNMQVGYLWFMAVDPPYQGQGIGTRLLEELARFLDARGESCYLETVDERNVRYYAKRGFTLTYTSNIPTTPLVFSAMVREPVKKE